MRKVLGWFLYIFGGGMTILSLQLMINCELIGAFREGKGTVLEFSQFLYQTSVEHNAYPNGYLIHWLRDIFLFLFGILVIRLGREQFVQVQKALEQRVDIVTCPGCGRKTYADAYCRLCGFNLVTYQPSREAPVFMPIWKLSLLAYSGLSLLLLIFNLLMIKLGWG
jgi:hypothetical protein